MVTENYEHTHTYIYIHTPYIFAYTHTHTHTHTQIHGTTTVTPAACMGSDPRVNKNKRGHIYRRGHAARSARSCNFGCNSRTKEFYDKPHIHFEDSSI